MAAKMERTRYPGIYKRGSRYVVVWRDDKGKQHNKSFATIKEALKFQGIVRQPGQKAAPARDLFEDYALAWVESYTGRTSKGFSEHARADYKRALTTYAIPFFKGKKLSDIDADAIAGFIAHLGKQKTKNGTKEKLLSPASVVKNLTPVKALFATAVERRRIPYNPTSGVRVNTRDEEEKPEPTFTDTELRALLDAAHNDRPHGVPWSWRLLFELFVQVGDRASEMIGLNKSDVKFERGGGVSYIDMRWQSYRDRTGKRTILKTNSGRRKIPLSPGMAEALWPLCQGPDGPLFATRGGKRLDYHNARRELKRTCERASVAWIEGHAFHRFRHTYASILEEQGSTDSLIARRLGHSNSNFTRQRYLHARGDELGDVGFLDALTGRSPMVDSATSGNSGDNFRPLPEVGA